MTFQMNKKLQQGFTLIELLVVIAIIGILAAMVITNLRTARAKARDASAITSLSSSRAEAENFYDSNGLSYTNLCANPAFATLITAAGRANGNLAACDATGVAFGPGQSYFAYIKMTATSDYFCVDGRGYAGKVTAIPSITADQCQ